MTPTRVWYLEMPAPGDLRPARDAGVTVELVDPPDGEVNHRFYREVGAAHHWVDLLERPPEWWHEHAGRVETWIARAGGEPAAYAELAQRLDGSVDVAYFGVLPAHQGRGIGGHLLTAAVRRAWELGAARVTVNTCELDGPHALDNYRARGFVVAREAVEDRALSRP
jgi:GNAT superfamily N-acetyltransferase